MIEIIFMCIILEALQIGDIISTEIGLRLGAEEINPIAKKLGFKMYIIKLIIPILMYFISLINRFILVGIFGALIGAIIITSLFLINNTIQIIRGYIING